jgi:hypothetical protein
MTVTALRLEPGFEIEGEGGVQVKVLHVDAQLEKTGCVITRKAYRTVHCKDGHCHTKTRPQYPSSNTSDF